MKEIKKFKIKKFQRPENSRMSSDQSGLVSKNTSSRNRCVEIDMKKDTKRRGNELYILVETGRKNREDVEENGETIAKSKQNFRFSMREKTGKIEKVFRLLIT